MTATHTTREAWLKQAVEAVRPIFRDADLNVPDVVHVSVGWPSKGATSAKKRTIGQCWAGAQSADGASHIFISPTLADPVKVLGVLVHELVHAAIGCQHGHKGPFQRAAASIGLTQPWTATGESEALLGRLRPLADALGEYPHPVLTVVGRVHTQKNRHRLYVCPGCDQKIRASKDDLNARCGDCDAPFILQEKGEGDEPINE